MDRDEGHAACKPIATRSLEKKWHAIKVQYAAFAVAKA